MVDEDRQARCAGHKFDESLDERIQHFEEKIGLRPDHEELALYLHKHVLLPALGRTYDDTPLEEEDWRMRDTEIDGLANFMGNPWDKMRGKNDD
jgi:hypothetical protein